MKIKDELVVDEELKAKLVKALVKAMQEIGVAPSPELPPPDTAPIFVAQRLNSTRFIAGLHRTLQLAGAWAPDELGLALVYHLNSWMKPSDIMRSMGEDIPLPKSWCVGDEFKVSPAVLDLFHLLPPSSRDLLQTAKSGERDRHGLVVLTIELEQVRSWHPACHRSCTCCHIVLATAASTSGVVNLRPVGLAACPGQHTCACCLISSSSTAADICNMRDSCIGVVRHAVDACSRLLWSFC